MYPNETAEHHRDHRCRNKEVNQFCYDPISKYRGNFWGCITGHHSVWAGSRSWVSRHLSLHLNIRGGKVRVRSCLIFRYRIWPKKQYILEKHSNLLQKYNSCRSLLPITHKYLSSHETRKHRHIFARVAAFWQRVFQTLPNLDVHPGVAVYHTLKIFSIVNAKDLLMPHTKFHVCTLKINTIFCHRKKNPITFEQECTYNIKFLSRHDEPIKWRSKGRFSHIGTSQVIVRCWWWRHNGLGNCDAHTRKVDISFIRYWFYSRWNSRPVV